MRSSYRRRRVRQAMRVRVGRLSSRRRPIANCRLRRLRRFLLATPAALGLAAAAACAAWISVGADLEDLRRRVAGQMAERRVALLTGRQGFFEEATAKLAQKKRETASAVIVLESLSQALPDDTYLTEFISRRVSSRYRRHARGRRPDRDHRADRPVQERHILRADNAGAAGDRRTVSYRSADRALFSGCPMSAPVRQWRNQRAGLGWRW